MPDEPNPIPKAVNWLRDLSDAGATRPQIFSCSDRTDRVLKIPGVGTADGPSLSAEWVGSLLAVELEILTPKPALVHLDEEALTTAPLGIRDRGECGLVFGTEYLDNAQTIIAPAGITACPNHSDLLSRLVVLDSWIETLDRMEPQYGRNLLVNTERGERTLMAIDFGMSFAPIVFRLVGAVPNVRIMRVQARAEIRPLLNRDTIAGAVAAAEQISDGDITLRVQSVPDAWLDDQRKGQMIRFLSERRGLLREAIAQELGIRL